MLFDFTTENTEVTKNSSFILRVLSVLCGKNLRRDLKMEITEKVKSIVTEQLGVDAEEVTEEASFIEDLGADSLDTVELVMAFEEEFGIVIPDEDDDKIRTVGEAIKYIEAHV